MACQVHQGNNLAGACNVVSAGMSSKERVIKDATLGVQLQAQKAPQSSLLGNTGLSLDMPISPSR